MIIALQALIYFRESFLSALEYVIGPYKNFFSSDEIENQDDEDSQDVYAEFDEEKGVVFFPPVYLQRYAAVMDCLMDKRWCGKLEKTVDLGYNDLSFIKYLKDLPGIKSIIGVDIEGLPYHHCLSNQLMGDLSMRREQPLQISLYQGNASDPDYRLIGCDAVVSIEMIEHMLPHDLEKLVHTVFGFIKPWIAIFTTPNGDFNSLFNALEENGLRRLDHYFEWSREQFHDWCSNIVLRYPQYTVTCKGIGPGPPSTEHLGCCSQMALFICNDYQKQESLDPNSLALISNFQGSDNLTDIIDSVDSKMLCLPDNESITNLYIEEETHTSYLPIVLSPTISMETIEYRDKTSQCNLEREVGKNFLMFDDESMCLSILIPRRNFINRVYDIEDVICRLNCTNNRVKNFSKTTQNLLEKNKIDCVVHTRQVVSDISELAKMLNIHNKNGMHKELENGSNIWRNMNWGENAPYWNQYYTLIKDFRLPLEVMSDENHLMVILSDTIGNLMDANYDELSVSMKKIEIPIAQLMDYVSHITKDTDKVKELLEWNGYEIEDDLVVFSRVVDNHATADEDWQDVNWNTTDLLSNSFANGGNVVPDYYDRCLRGAIERKVYSIRSLLTNEVEVRTELDQVICKLMCMTLRASQGCQDPPPFKWLLCKLLDLLTLAKNAIERKKRRYVQKYSWKGIDNKGERAIDKFRENDTTKQIVNKYQFLLKTLDSNEIGEELSKKYRCMELELEDDLSSINNELMTDYEYNRDEQYSPGVVYDNMVSYGLFLDDLYDIIDENNLARTRAWLEDDVKLVPYSKNDILSDNISSGDNDHSVCRNIAKRPKKNTKNRNTKRKVVATMKNITRKKSVIAHNKVLVEDKTEVKVNFNKHKSTHKRSSYSSLSRKCLSKLSYLKQVVAPESEMCNILIPKVNVTKPIPGNILELCQPHVSAINTLQNQNSTSRMNIDANECCIEEYFISNEKNVFVNPNHAATETVHYINIVMENMEEEIVVLRRTIGTDADGTAAILECETEISNVMNEDSFHDKSLMWTENIQSEAVFLHDINEPSTSKGIRHVSMDVQCGPDLSISHTVLSHTSLTRMPKVFMTGIKIGNSITNIKAKRCIDFGTSTNETHEDLKILQRKTKTVGIKIRDSNTNVKDQFDIDIGQNSTQPAIIETKLIKKTCSNTKTLDSGSEFCGSVTSGLKSPSRFAGSPKNISDFQFNCSASRTEQRFISALYKRSKLSCGGVHTHSYNNKQTSEDVVFQGEWQKQRSKNLQRKGMYSTAINKKVANVIKNKRVNSKDLRKFPFKKDVKIEQKGPFPMRNARPTKTESKGQPENISNLKISTRFPLSSASVKKVQYPQKTSTPKSFLKKDVHGVLNQKLSPKNLTVIATKDKPINDKEGKRSCLKNLTKPVNIKKQSILSRNNSKSNNESYKTKDLKMTTTSNINKPNDNFKEDTKKQLMRKGTNLSYNLEKYMTAAKLNSKLNGAMESIRNNFYGNKEDGNTKVETLVVNKSKSKIFGKNLLKFRNEPRKNINYLVFRNEIDNNKKRTKYEPPTNSRRSDTNKRAHSPSSLNSSSCSSPNSITTVRAASPQTLFNRTHSSSSHRSNYADIESESNTPTKIRLLEQFNRCKKLTKKTNKCSKNQKNIECNNKENVAECSRNISLKEYEKSMKGAFTGKNKNVFVAELGNDSTITMNKAPKQRTHSKKSLINLPNDSFFEEMEQINMSSLSKKTSSESGKTFVKESKHSDCANQSKICTDYLGTDIIICNNSLENQPSTNVDHNQEINIVDNSLLKEWMYARNEDAIQNHATNILEAMRHLVEERLNFIPTNSFCESISEIDYHNKTNNSTCCGNDLGNNSSYLCSDTGSLTLENLGKVLGGSFYGSYSQESEVSNHSESVRMTDTDLLSFKSVTSASKLSEYYLADGELNNTLKLLQRTSSASKNTTANQSFQNLFERREQSQLQLPETGGIFAVQTFSGLSVNAEPVAGNKPDYVNLVDSETGSIACQLTRKTSEELFVSGRSSGTYESCLIDDEDVIPSWLFNLLNQPPEQEPEPPQQIILPTVEPIFDINDNVVEPALGAGAGDGRGMHSDHSQYSSGRGTSLSSTDTSTETSEAVLIDPSAYSGQYVLPRDAEGNPIVIPLFNAPLEDTDNNVAQENDNNNTPRHSRRQQARSLRSYVISSDADADVSSLDTDVPDN